MTARKPNPADLDLTKVEWTVSSHSGGGGDCVRIGILEGNEGRHVLIGDSKHPERLPHVYTPAEAKAWLLGAKGGEFDFLLALG
ncbi:DUF397 domain-containing protein (plasmid) [Streptosporangium sp. CA-135522]|uniref:DUF397 domain-containing protein n=1 Tax=Streptosporangium sp. CA-135522 TaxID=3240072 RepID=UPI003D9329B6